MNETTATLFDEFATAYRGDEVPDVLDYLERAGDDADALADLIDRFLQSVPARESTEEEIVLAHARLEQEAPILVLRRRRALKRDVIVDALVRVLGLDPAKRSKVDRYYHGLEVGILDPAPVDARVWEVLGDVLNANVRRLADYVPSGPAPAAPAFRRIPDGGWTEGVSQRVLARADAKTSERDEIDRLFTGMA